MSTFIINSLNVMIHPPKVRLACTCEQLHNPSTPCGNLPHLKWDQLIGCHMKATRKSDPHSTVHLLLQNRRGNEVISKKKEVMKMLITLSVVIIRILISSCNCSLQSVVLLSGDLGRMNLLWWKMLMTQMFVRHGKNNLRETKQLGKHNPFLFQ